MSIFMSISINQSVNLSIYLSKPMFFPVKKACAENYIFAIKRKGLMQLLPKIKAWTL